MDPEVECAFVELGVEDESPDLAQVLVNNASYTGRRLTTDVRVPGRIGNPKFFNFWRDELKASPFVLSTISEGYKFPFKAYPPGGICANNKSMLVQSDFALAELLRLEKLGCITRVDTQPFLCLPLSVVFSKKLRLVVDASRHLNPYLEDRKIKLEDLDVREQLFRKDDYQTKIDLDSGYWHVPLFEGHKKYVGCHFIKEDGSILYWIWNVLFLGIKDAVYIFSKLLVPHKTYLRGLGIRNTIYIDDQSVMAQGYSLCQAHTQISLTTFEKAGWVVNFKKSGDPPVQKMEFLGLLISSTDLKYYVPDAKKLSICDLICKILNSKKVHIKTLAKLCGKLQFCFKAFGPVVKLLTRSSYYLISRASSWNSMIIMSEAAKRELNYLFLHFEVLNGFPIRASLSASPIQFKFASDASDIGNCVYEIACAENNVLHKRMFTLSEAKSSSTRRELLAFHDFYLSDLAAQYSDSNIVHYTDNKNCEIILEVGSRNVTLQPLVLDIFLAWKRRNLKVDVIYLPREDPIIMFADLETKNFDIHDFGLDFDNFLVLTSLFGSFDIDCFASKSNHKCLYYFSKFKDSQALGINFFAQVLPDANLYIFPPVHLIIPTIFHLQRFSSKGCLIVPLWRSSSFWTFLCADGVHFNSFICKVYSFSPSFVAGDFIRNNVFRGVQKFKTLALAVDFTEIHDLFQPQIIPNFCLFDGCKKCIETY